MDIPRDKLVVITGLSGSGKSSLAFDTLYAEGQRRYVECLSVYARQFLGPMERPNVDKIEGLSPAISIEQKTVSRNPRSTVGTVTEIYDYLRLLFARVGVQHCHKCGTPVQRQTQDQMVDRILSLPRKSRIVILAPVVRGRKGHYRELFEEIAKDGFTRARVDGEIREITPGMKLNRYRIHNIEVVIDRLVIMKEIRSRLAESIEIGLKTGDGVVIIQTDEGDLLFSQKNACPVDGTSYDDPAPNNFSFNSPFGACPACNGLGERKEFDLDLILPDRELTLRREGIAPLGKPRSNWWWAQVEAVARAYGFDYDTPIKDIPKEALDVLLYGSGKQKYEIVYTHPGGRSVTYHQTVSGVFNSLQHYYETTTSSGIREWAESFMNTLPCEACRGGRLREESLAVRFHEKSIADVARMSVLDAHASFTTLELTGREQLIGEQILKEIRSRLTFLLDVGLGYLTLDRSARSLSGGEAQRIRLATQIGTQLVGVMYILDEPSIGLHQRDNHRLIQSLKDLRDLGNTVIVVEHDRDMITNADYIIDLGPGAGEHGGHMIKTGTPRQFLRRNAHQEKTVGKPPYTLNGSLTAQYISGKRRIEPPRQRRTGNGYALVLEGAKGNNLKDITLSIPLGTFTCITGVSGSGKSSLINETLYRALGKRLMHMKAVPLPHRTIHGLEHVDKVIDIDQTPIGRTPRSNPATYTGVFTHIRDLFANLPESKIRGYKPGRFSFNVSEGSCDACKGDGVRKIEMNFLPDVYVVCDVCNGRRYDRETLAVHFRGKSINDVLNMTVEEARELFSEIHPIKRKLDTLYDVGLGYIRLGQRATTLSGGEAQRVKLATELSKISTGKTVYILDEPTTGLHFEDVRMLLGVLNRLVDRGNTVIVIEHNLEVIKCADWIVDLGPEGGDDGGYIVAQGTPEAILKSKKSYTADFLRRELTQPQSKRKAPHA